MDHRLDTASDVDDAPALDAAPAADAAPGAPDAGPDRSTLDELDAELAAIEAAIDRIESGDFAATSDGAEVTPAGGLEVGALGASGHAMIGAGDFGQFPLFDAFSLASSATMCDQAAAPATAFSTATAAARISRWTRRPPPPGSTYGRAAPNTPASPSSSARDTASLPPRPPPASSACASAIRRRPGSS
jgi:hypothetical protein